MIDDDDIIVQDRQEMDEYQITTEMVDDSLKLVGLPPVLDQIYQSNFSLKDLSDSKELVKMIKTILSIYNYTQPIHTEVKN